MWPIDVWYFEMKNSAYIKLLAEVYIQKCFVYQYVIGLVGGGGSMCISLFLGIA